MSHRVNIALKNIALLLVWSSLAITSAMAAASRNPADAPSGTYRMDPAHSFVLFSILHTGLTYYYGRIDRLSGTIDFNSSQPRKSHTSITIDMDSIDVPNPRLVEELKAPDTFNVSQFPTARFVSTRIVRTGPDSGKITGNLTIRNVTKPVTLDVLFRGTVRNPMSNLHQLGVHATAMIKRSEFGLTGMRWEPFVGDDVMLTVEGLFQEEKK